jgi:hypothetical protein
MTTYGNRGKSLESAVKKLFASYESRGIHCQQNFPEQLSDGTKVKRHGFDFQILHNGKFYAFDAKECALNAWPLDKAKPHQVKALLDRLKPSLSRSAHVTLSMAALSVHNGKLRVIVEDDLSSRVLNDHNVRNMLTDAAAAVLGTTAPAEVLTEGAADTSNDAGSGFDLLAELGRASGIDVNIR